MEKTKELLEKEEELRTVKETLKELKKEKKKQKVAKKVSRFYSFLDIFIIATFCTIGFFVGGREANKYFR